MEANAYAKAKTAVTGKTVKGFSCLIVGCEAGEAVPFSSPLFSVLQHRNPEAGEPKI